MNKKRLLGLIALPLLLGCAEDRYATWALRVDVQDARTGAPTYDVTVIAQDGAYADTVEISSFGDPVRSIALLAENRPGTYDVTVIHPAYETWHRSGIRVTTSGTRNPFDGSPVPDQVHVLAELQPRDGN